MRSRYYNFKNSEVCLEINISFQLRSRASKTPPAGGVDTQLGGERVEEDEDEEDSDGFEVVLPGEKEERTPPKPAKRQAPQPPPRKKNLQLDSWDSD